MDKYTMEDGASQRWQNAVGCCRKTFQMFIASENVSRRASLGKMCYVLTYEFILYIKCFVTQLYITSFLDFYSKMIISLT